MQAEVLTLPHVAHEGRRLLAFVQRGRALAARAPADFLHEGGVGGALPVGRPVHTVRLLRVVEALGHPRHLLGPPSRHLGQVARPSHRDVRSLGAAVEQQERVTLTDQVLAPHLQRPFRPHAARLACERVLVDGEQLG
eukprot:scaffold13333_cov66-Phaeocystis_antarctica.AAC.4